MEYGWVFIAGLIVRETVQVIVDAWAAAGESRGVKLLISAVVTVAVCLLLSLLPDVEFTEEFVGSVWAAAFVVHLAKTRLWPKKGA